MKEAFRPITYSVKHDSRPTIKQIRVHNRTGEKLGLWEE